MPSNSPPGPPGAPVPSAPLAPLPINGRPNNAWAGAFTTPNKSCNGAALVASATTYERAPFVRDCTNWA
ncbi:Uncharacterised protein [Mycobacterium tuberculosis]|nr:Uncharacterised protein [Mycobacterium tuberculosis]COY89030.1 Uncharacterised protein [Mycobacterium tuberculosis]